MARTRKQLNLVATAQLALIAVLAIYVTKYLVSHIFPTSAPSSRDPGKFNSDWWTQQQPLPARRSAQDSAILPLAQTVTEALAKTPAETPAGTPAGTPVGGVLAGLPPAAFATLEDIPRHELLLLTFANANYWQLALNWVAHVRILGLPHVVVAADAETERNCVAAGITHLRTRHAHNSSNVRQQVDSFRNLTSTKSETVLMLFREYAFQAISVSDADTVWLRNPQDLIAKYPSVDFFPSTDCLSYQAELNLYKNVPRCGHLTGSTHFLGVNSGIYIVRNNPATRSLLESWNTRLQDKNNKYKVGDQQLLNIMLHEGGSKPVPSDPENPHIVLMWGKKIRTFPLPVLAAMNGHVAFLQNLPERHGVAPYIVHTTFQRHDMAGRIFRLRWRAWWMLDGLDYYSNNGLGFITYENGVRAYVAGLVSQRAKSAKATSLMWQHMAAGAYQYAALRDALGMARALNRTLIFPDFVCYCDQDQVATVLNECRMEGSDLELPFICPADIFINPTKLDKLGQILPYRTPNFLNHPKLPDRIRQSRVKVGVHSSFKALKDANQKAIGLTPNVLFGYTASELKEAVEDFSSAAVLDWPVLAPGSFGGFSESAVNKHFDKAILEMFSGSGIWCCGGGDWSRQWNYVNWGYQKPVPLADPNFKTASWVEPDIRKPGWCGKLEGENKKFGQLPNHPCMYD